MFTKQIVPGDFDPAYYLFLNPDVASAGVDPTRHYLEYGKNEGRKYLASSPFLETATLEFAKAHELSDLLKGSKLPRRHPQRVLRAFSGFDALNYVTTNPDLKIKPADALDHFISYGWLEGRKPSRGFSTKDLIAANPEARAILLALHKNRPSEHPSSGHRRLNYKVRSAVAWLYKSVIRRIKISRQATILFVSYFEGALGIGDSARALALAMIKVGVKLRLYPYNTGIEDRLLNSFMKNHCSPLSVPDIVIIEVALNEFPALLKNLGLDVPGRPYIILRTYWELDRLPQSWIPYLKNADEIWAPTNFVAASFEKAFPRTISLIPPPVAIGLVSHDRAKFGFQDGIVYYIFIFDRSSWISRKNPDGVVRAFLAAFPTGQEKVALVIKTHGPTTVQSDAESEMIAICKADSRITIFEEYLDRDDLLTLIKSCDCFVSLHRAEGFGLGIAEAMAMSKPVITCGYSGFADMIPRDAAYIIPYKMVGVKEGQYVVHNDQQWAEPDENAASSAFREVYTGRESAAARGMRGGEFVKSAFGEKRIGLLARARLREIYSSPFERHL